MVVIGLSLDLILIVRLIVVIGLRSSLAVCVIRIVVVSLVARFVLVAEGRRLPLFIVVMRMLIVLAVVVLEWVSCVLSCVTAA